MSPLCFCPAQMRFEVFFLCIKQVQLIIQNSEESDLDQFKTRSDSQIPAVINVAQESSALYRRCHLDTLPLQE